MPTYNYRCDKCNHDFEAFHSMSCVAPQLCPVCGEAGKKLVSASTIIYKGAGFYSTDYAHSGLSEKAKEKKVITEPIKPLTVKDLELIESRNQTSSSEKATTSLVETLSAEKLAAKKEMKLMDFYKKTSDDDALSIYNSEHKLIFTIKGTGDVIIGDGVELTTAAKAFVQAIGNEQKFVAAKKRVAHYLRLKASCYSLQQELEKDLELSKLSFSEGLCKQCGACCADKIITSNGLRAYHTSCKFLKGKTCSVYQDRKNASPECLSAKEALLAGILPATCGYVEANWDLIKHWYTPPDYSEIKIDATPDK